MDETRLLRELARARELIRGSEPGAAITLLENLAGTLSADSEAMSEKARESLAETVLICKAAQDGAQRAVLYIEALLSGRNLHTYNLNGERDRDITQKTSATRF